MLASRPDAFRANSTSSETAPYPRRVTAPGIGASSGGQSRTLQAEGLPRGGLRSLPFTTAEVAPLPHTGFIDHVGIGVPDLVAAKQYYDDLMHVLGLREWFEPAPEGLSTTGLTAPKAHSCSSTRQRNREPSHAARPAFITSHSWSRAEETHTSGQCEREAVILDEPREIPITANTVLRPTGLIPMDSSWRRFAAIPTTARPDRGER